MAKEIDKIIQSKTAPKSNNVLWDDGENLKINRRGKWENTSKESSSNKELYAYPVDTLDGKENKVVGLGGDSIYTYIGELIASEDGTPTEGELTGEVFPTIYCYQPIYDGKYRDYFEELLPEYITLYIGNDIDGYSSNKVYMSEDANNLTYYDFYFIAGFGPIALKVAISPEYKLYYRNYYHYANKNSKVFFALSKQQLDINLIPQEIPRKEDISAEVIKSIKNYNNSECLAEFYTYVAEKNIVKFGLHISNGELGSKLLKINNYMEGIPISFQYEREDNTSFYYSSDVADIKINKTLNFLGPDNVSVYAYNVTAHKHVYKIFYKSDDTLDFLEHRTQGEKVLDNYSNIYGIKIYLEYDNILDIIDSAHKFPNICVYIKNRYIEFRTRNKRTEKSDKYYTCIDLEVIKEIDISSLESRLAALEAK